MFRGPPPSGPPPRQIGSQLNQLNPFPNPYPGPRPGPIPGQVQGNPFSGPRPGPIPGQGQGQGNSYPSPYAPPPRGPPPRGPPPSGSQNFQMVTINAPTVTPILGSLKVTCLRGIELRAGQGIFYLFSCIDLILVN